jgi:TPR repeat protein
MKNEGSLMKARNILLILTALIIASAHAAPPDSSCDAKAVAVREERAAQGDPRAQFWLGTQLEYGACGARDRERANALFQQSAAQDFPPAVHVLGVILRRDGNDGEAIKYFERSAQLGFQMGIVDLGFTYGQRDSSVRDAVLSYAWLTLAMSREPKAELKEYLDSSRTKVVRALSDTDLVRAKGIADDLSTRFSSIPVWLDRQ